MPTLKELREDRAKIVKQAQAMFDEFAADDGTMPGDKEEQWNTMLNDADGLKDQIKRLEAGEFNREQMARLTSELNQSKPRLSVQAYGEDAGGNRQGQPKHEPFVVRQGLRTVAGDPTHRATEDYVKGFENYLGTGEKFAALQSDDADQAGYLVASETFAAGILQDVNDLIFIRRYATIHTVPTADSLGIRKRTSKMNTFGWSAEIQTPDADSNLAFGKKSLTPHYLSGRILVSRDLIRRGGGMVQSYVQGEMARDMSETEEDGFLTGNGSQQPLGVFTASDDGISTARDVVTGSATNMTADALIDAKMTLKSQYRNGGGMMGPRWLMHRDVLKLCMKLKDGNSRYHLYEPAGIAGGESDTLLNIPIDESERAPNTISNGNYAALLANWRYYEIADALDMELMRLDELNARTNQVEYILRRKTDGMPTLEEAFVRMKFST